MYEPEGRMRGIDPESPDMKEFNHQVQLETGVMEEECSALMKEFFKELRMKQKMRKKSLAE